MLHVIVKYIPTVSSLFLKWPVYACLPIPAIPISFVPQAPAMLSASQPPFHIVAKTHDSSQSNFTTLSSPQTILWHAIMLSNSTEPISITLKFHFSKWSCKRSGLLAQQCATHWNVLQSGIQTPTQRLCVLTTWYAQQKLYRWVGPAVMIKANTMRAFVLQPNQNMANWSHRNMRLFD